MSEVVREYHVSKFSGKYPDVPVADGVSLEELADMDDKPLFATLPIVPRIGTVSKNGLLYDEDLTTALEQQINSKRPGGIFGHLKEEDRSTAFPMPEGIWVGALRVGETLWAKAYIPPGAARNHIRRLKAVSGSIATSIYGRGSFETVSKGVRRLKDFNLESLDFAQPDRAALGFGAAPMITSEMDDDNKEGNMPTKEELIAELTLKEIPASLISEAIAAHEAKSKTSDRIAELTQEVTDRDEQINTLTEAVSVFQVSEFTRAVDVKIDTLINWQVTGEEATKRVDSLKRTLRSRVVSELGDKRDSASIETVTAEVWTDLQPLAEMVRDALAGPPAAIGGKRDKRQEFDASPAAQENARSDWTM